jgi:alpha-D-ribose 1-methylphosphonate 5-triphosphate synthase subunit PhnH
MTDTNVLLSARLTGDQSRTVFRVVLEALSRPGKVVDLPAGVATGVPPAVVPVLALADLDVAVATLEAGEEIAWASSIRSVTGCHLAAVTDADMVVAVRPPTADEVGALRIGTADAPERGARLFVSCAAITEGSTGAGVVIRVQGPGASAGRTITITGVEADVFRTLAAVNRGFPAGVDTWLVTGDRRMVAISRSSRIDVLTDTDPEGAG